MYSISFEEVLEQEVFEQLAHDLVDHYAYGTMEHSATADDLRNLMHDSAWVEEYEPGLARW